jgi:hypothetical protein
MVYEHDSGRPRARRLTLAPIPRAVVVQEAAEEFCAGDGPPPEGGRPVKLSADPLAGRRRQVRGSKFWPLADELSSDEEVNELCSDEEVDEPCSRVVEADFWSPGASAAVGVPSDDVHAEEETRAVEKQPDRAAKVCSFICFAGQGGRSADRTTDAVAARRLEPKPWHGPLPAARRSPRVTLGDVLAKATKTPLRKGTPKGSASAPASFVQATMATATSCSPPAGGVVTSRSNFEFRQRPRDPGTAGRVVGSSAGPKSVGPPHSITIRNKGRVAQFTFSAGLSALFLRAGRRRSSALAPSQRLSHRPISPLPDESPPCLLHCSPVVR